MSERCDECGRGASWWDDLDDDNKILALLIGGMLAMVCFICLLAVL